MRHIGFSIAVLVRNIQSGFNLTFQKQFVRFQNKNKRKTDLKCCHGWTTKKIFHSGSPKTALKPFMTDANITASVMKELDGISFTFLS